MLQRRQRKQHDHHAEAVDGAYRAVEEAAVDQLAGGDGGIHNFQAPADAGINEEIRQDLIQRKAADRGVGEEGNHKIIPQFCFLTILYSSPGSKKGQAAVVRER